MSEVIVKLPDGSERRLQCAEGWRLMEILRDWDVPIGAECGGSATCGQCRVEVAPEWRYKINPRTPDEDIKLDEMFDVTDDTRLACQILWQEEFDGLTITIPPSDD